MAYDGTGFLGVKEIIDQAGTTKKDDIIKAMETTHRQRMDQVGIPSCFVPNSIHTSICSGHGFL